MTPRLASAPDAATFVPGRPWILRLAPASRALAFAVCCTLPVPAQLDARPEVSPPVAPPNELLPDFVNWESPHVHPLDLTADGLLLLAVNTADARLEVVDASQTKLAYLQSVPVGLDPVSVRARGNTEAWVVNHISDSVSVVDLPSGRVRATLTTDDEPADVVFAGSPQRAFVSCSQANTVLVFDPSNLDAPPQRIKIVAEEPRALAVSPDGNTVYVGIFESGNGTTILGGGSTEGGGFPPNAVSEALGPYGGTNPPPNEGELFAPAIAPGLPTPPAVGLVVRQTEDGSWLDDAGTDWTSLVSGPDARLSGRPPGWRLLDRDVARIDTATLSVSWVDRLMNLVMALGVNPASGDLTVVGTDATNEVRFLPNVRGTFVRVLGARVPAAAGRKALFDLNGHLDYSTSTVQQELRDLSLGDPRGIAFNAAGTAAWVTGMGSSNVVVIAPDGSRLAPPIGVGNGPTGIVLQEAKGRGFVLNKFDASVSVIDLAQHKQLFRVKFHDATTLAVRRGRRHLYDTHATSGLGQAACASCHVDARMDRLAWDLGDPAGEMASVADQNPGAGNPDFSEGMEDFHPMKGPMTTQTLQDIIGNEPLHWRGDKDGLEEFNGAFEALQGDDEQLSASEMQEFEDFLASLHFPPNPYRNFDNSLPTSVDLEGHFTTGKFAPEGLPLGTGDAVKGMKLFRGPNGLVGGEVDCVSCHTFPTGMGPDGSFVDGVFQPWPPGPLGEHHHALVGIDATTNKSIKTPQLRNLYEKVGFDMAVQTSRAGFGFIHDGSVDSIARFLSKPTFGLASDQEIADVVAFLLAFSGSGLPSGSETNPLAPPGSKSQDTHAAVGKQVTLGGGRITPAQEQLLLSMLALAEAGDVGLIAKGRSAGLARGWTYAGAKTFQSDRRDETSSAGALAAGTRPGNELTFTVVPKGCEWRLGVDRDGDGAFDRDELDAGSDPADAGSGPLAGTGAVLR